MSIVREIWIITEGGIPLYDQRVEEEIDKVLIAGFIATINNFIKELSGEECKRILLSNSQICILSCEETGLFFVSRSNPNINFKKIEKYLKKLKANFLEHYKEEIEHFNGNMEVFKDVNQVINIKEDSENFLGVKIDKKVSKSVLSKL